MTAFIPPQAILEPTKGHGSKHTWTVKKIKGWTKLLWSTTPEQWRCLDKLNTQESHWNWRARGSKTTLGRAYGIAQALPAKKMNQISKDWKTNPATQVVWQKKYIELRYSNKPCYALAHEKRKGWY
jgi:hypothetical protein